MTTSPQLTPQSRPDHGDQASERRHPGHAPGCPICRRTSCLALQCARDMDTTLYAQQTNGR